MARLGGEDGQLAPEAPFNELPHRWGGNSACPRRSRL